MLKDKTILFIAPKYFNYHIQIAKELKVLGANVYFFQEKKETIIYRILRNFSPAGFKIYNRLYEKIIEQKINKLRIEYFFLIRGEHISNKFIRKILQKNKNCKSIYYQWDSFENNPNGLNIYHNFNKCFSFDRIDCANIIEFKYLPLFYIEEYKKLRDYTNHTLYDILFIGTFHDTRYDQLQNFEFFCKNNELKLKFHLYLPAIRYLKFIILNRRFLKKISFNKLSEIEVINLVSQSKGILDLPNTYQQGMTIRAIEALAAGKKLITTSTSIIQEDFYSKDVVLQLDNCRLTSDFLDSSDQADLDKLKSLNQWITKIFE